MKIHIQQHQKLAMGISDTNHRDGMRKQESVVSREKISTSVNNKNQSANVNFKGGFFNAIGKTEKEFYTSKGFEKFAKLTTKPVLLESVAAIGFASILRPTTIMAMPGDKRDKQYAAAHGVATGAWGYATASLLFGPIDKAVGNVVKNSKKDSSYLTKTKWTKKGTEAFDAMGKYGPKFLLRPAEAALTIAFIPFVMKKIFPHHPKSNPKTKAENNNVQNVAKNSQQNITVKDTSFKSNLKIKHSAKTNETFKNFTGNALLSSPSFSGGQKTLLTEAKKAWDGEKNYIHKFQAYTGKLLEPTVKKVMDNPKVQEFAEKFGDDKKIGKLKDFFLSGTALLGTMVYMNRTMKSKEIEPERKKTLAANMGITWGLSTLGAMFLDSKVKKGFKKMADNYEKYKKEEIAEKVEKGTLASDEDLKGFVDGLKDGIFKHKEGDKEVEISLKNLDLKKVADKAKVVDAFAKDKIGGLNAKVGQIGGWAPKVIAFTLIYRYLTPVVATPLADMWKKHVAKDPHGTGEKQAA